MDYNSLHTFKNFARKYLDSQKSLKILDIGSMSWDNPRRNFTFRRYFSPLWKYVGLDLSPGHNVDIVSEDPAHYPLPDNDFSVVICSSILEHATDPFAVAKEIGRILKPNGFAFVTVPYRRNLHNCPGDFWRMTCDGLSLLMKDIAMLEVLESYFIGTKSIDSVCVAKKLSTSPL